MSSIPSNIARVSNQLRSDLMRNNLRRTNVELLELQVQLATGRKVNRPSDAPESISAIIDLRAQLEQFEQRAKNFSLASSSIDNTDHALGSISELLLEAQGIASSQVGVGSDSATRANQASVVNAQIGAMIQMANRQFQDVFLFAGDRSRVTPFVDHLGGIRYAGGSGELLTDLGVGAPLGYNVSGAAALGALSARVSNGIDLDPRATSATRIADVRGATNRGVSAGIINVDVNGTDVQVDLNSADTLGDVVTRVNDAINSVDPAAGSLAVSSAGFTLTANAGHTITITDIAQGVTADHLGVRISAASGNTVGGDIDPILTALTEIAALNQPVNLAGGLKVTNGAVTTVIDTSSAVTIQDLINAAISEDVGLRLEINADGRSIDALNEISGTELSIGENAGGSTAGDLGIRSFSRTTTLADFRHGLGIETNGDAQTDIRFTLHDSSRNFEVDLEGVLNVNDVIVAIETAAVAAGLTLGVDFSVGLAADGNGLDVIDNTAGAGSFAIGSINLSFAAEHLGIADGVGVGTTITGTDVATIRTESVLSHLMMLRDGLLNDDQLAITLAGSALQLDVDRIATTRAEVGVRSRRVAAEENRLSSRDIQARQLLSEAQDADYTEVISRFTQLQQQLEANLVSAQQVLQLTLLDFLR